MYDIRSFRRYLTRDQVLTIPNLLSFARMAVIPFLIWTYATRRYTAAVILLAVSELTDVLDGLIARKFNMVTELGKALDPLCDKLMQGALVACLLIRHHGKWYFWVFFGFLAVKEISMLVLGWQAARRTGRMQSSRWYGKVSTVVLDGCMLAIFLWPDMPERTIQILLCVSAAAMLLSLVLYSALWVRLIRQGVQEREPMKHEKQETEHHDDTV